MNPTPHIVESALLLLAAFLLGCVIGYFARRFAGQRPQTAVATPIPLAPATPPATIAAAPLATEPLQVTEATRPKAARKARAAKAPSRTPKRAAKTVDEPELLSAPRDGVADDLKKIKGIGPKLEAVLNENGVYHYDQIASWNANAIAVMDQRLSFRGRIEREQWVAQAKVLAEKG